MNTRNTVILIGALILGAFFAVKTRATSKMGEKFSKNVFPNDFGATTIDVSHYPKKMQGYYKLFLVKCSKCHTIARPINAQFLQLTQGEMRLVERQTPEVFKDTNVWKVSPTIWKKYVHKMMSKPGATISKEEGKHIYEFLVFYSQVRKTGAHAEGWQKQRQGLLDKLKRICKGL